MTIVQKPYYLVYIHIMVILHYVPEQQPSPLCACHGSLFFETHSGTQKGITLDVGQSSRLFLQIGGPLK